MKIASSAAASTWTSSARISRYIPAMVSRSQGAPGDSVYPHQCFMNFSYASSASNSSMVCDSASEEESRYLAVNSYLPKYSSMRNGDTCMQEVSQPGVRNVQSQDGRRGPDR